MFCGELKISTAANAVVQMIDSVDHITGKAGLTLTITASKDGAAFAGISPTVTDLGSGWYALAFTTTHTNTKGFLALHITGTGADPKDPHWLVVTDTSGDTVASVTGAVGSVTGAVGSVTGAVGSVTGLTASNLDATVSSRLATSGYTAPSSAATIAAAVLDAVVETGFSLKESTRLMLAALVGKLSGAPGTSITIRDVNDAKNRIVATVDANGNRTAVTKDVT